MGKIIGIDLGTTNCCAAVIVDGKPVVIPNSQGGLITPSVVSFDDDGTCLVGEPARRRAILHPLRTVYSIKRFMGESYDATEKLARSMPYRVGRGDNHLPKFDGGYRWLTPQEVSAEILRTVKHNAEEYLGAPVDEAVITVPAYFNDLQRQATKEAGELAGFKVRRIVAEPTAAALAYGLGKNLRDEHIAVFHLGGGTFDISILNIGDGVYEVESTSGNTRLGGDDFDKAIVDWLATDFKATQGIDLRLDPTALQRLREAAEKAKRELSTAQETDINLPFIASAKGLPLSLSRTLTRTHFETLCAELIEALEGPCRIAMSAHHVSEKTKIKKVLLVGGGTRIPAVQKKIGEIFGMEPSMNVNPDEAVAIGAAIQGAVIAGDVNMKDTLLLDVIPLSLGIETQGGKMTTLIPANSTIPTNRSQTFSTTVDNQTEVQLRILQGERPLANDNRTVGRVTLSGITQAPKGVTQIEVTFDIDANGILDVTAEEKGTGKKVHVRVESERNITEEDFCQGGNYYVQPVYPPTTTSSDSSSSSNHSSSSHSSSSNSDSDTSSQSEQESSPSSFTPAYHDTPSTPWWSSGTWIPFAVTLLVGTLLVVIFSSFHSCDDDPYALTEENYIPIEQLDSACACEATDSYSGYNTSYSSSNIYYKTHYETIKIPFGGSVTIPLGIEPIIGLASYPDYRSFKAISVDTMMHSKDNELFDKALRFIYNNPSDSTSDHKSLLEKKQELLRRISRLHVETVPDSVTDNTLDDVDEIKEPSVDSVDLEL